MTLCIAWKSQGVVRFASDSRLTFGNSSYADVGIKVLSVPYQILSPAIADDFTHRDVDFKGELGMCFAGSTTNSLTIKESMVEVLKYLQYVPGYSDINMDGIIEFIFTTYKLISQRVCETDMGSNGRADIIIGGLCPKMKVVRVFRLSTDSNNHHPKVEILTRDNSHCLLGTGADFAENNLPRNPSDLDYQNILKSAIDDKNLASVGGNVQYGEFRGNQFVVFGVLEVGNEVHYWRGALDLNSEDFTTGHTIITPGIPFIEPFSTIGI